jgi:hypothetical protein
MGSSQRTWWRVEKSKFQNPNPKQIPSTKLQKARGGMMGLAQLHHERKAGEQRLLEFGVCLGFGF